VAPFATWTETRNVFWVGQLASFDSREVNPPAPLVTALNPAAPTAPRSIWQDDDEL